LQSERDKVMWSRFGDTQKENEHKVLQFNLHKLSGQTTTHKKYQKNTSKA